MHLGLKKTFETTTTNYQINNSKYHIYISEYVKQSVINKLVIQKISCVIPLGPFSYEGMKTEIRQINNKSPIELLLFGKIAEYKGVKNTGRSI